MQYILAPTRLHEFFTHCAKDNAVAAVSSGRRESIAPTRLHEYFTHCVKNSACSSGRPETHSACKTVGILHALRQTQCGERRAAAEVKIIKSHLCLFFHNFFGSFFI
ncbi:unnamed protein product, partial [Bemisia tabaci]